MFQEVAVAVAPNGILMGKLDIEANKDVKSRYSIVHEWVGGFPSFNVAFIFVNYLFISEVFFCCFRYQIKQVPEARIFKKGVMYPYEGPGDLEGVKGKVSSHLQIDPSIIICSTLEPLQPSRTSWSRSA